MVLTLVVGLWLTPFLLGRIGTHEYGLWLITTQILGYLMLLDLGVVALAPRETAYATGRRISGEANDVPATFADAVARFRQRYRLVYTPARQTPGVHAIDVRMKDPTLRAIARSFAVHSHVAHRP